jgi:hypothetical protein
VADDTDCLRPSDITRARILADEDADRIRQKHFEFFFEQFRSAESILHGREQVAMLQRLTVEQERARGARVGAGYTDRQRRCA